MVRRVVEKVEVVENRESCGAGECFLIEVLRVWVSFFDNMRFEEI